MRDATADLGHYKAQLTQSFAVSAVYQPVINPGYDRDRRPIQFFALRAHAAF